MINKMNKKNGPDFTVAYLKESYRIVTKWISGSPVDTSQGVLRVGTRQGLPTIIPSLLRKEILSGNKLSLRVVLTILSFFRVIRATSTLKLSTITGSFTGKSKKLPDYEVAMAMSVFFKNFTVPKIVPSFNLRPLTTAGPNLNVSLKAAPLDAFAFSKEPALLGHLRKVAETTGPNIAKLLDKEMNSYSSYLSLFTSDDLSKAKLGKLSLKEEAAGKVRVFAIADI